MGHKFSFCEGCKTVHSCDNCVHIMTRVAEVTICKDCKWCYINKFGSESLTGMCTLFSRAVQHNDFCSYAEKRDAKNNEKKEIQ